MFSVVPVLNSESTKLFLLTYWIRTADPENKFTNKFHCSADNKLFEGFFPQWHVLQHAKGFPYLIYLRYNAWRSLGLLFKHCTTPKPLKFKYRKIIAQKQFCLPMLFINLTQFSARLKPTICCLVLDLKKKKKERKGGEREKEDTIQAYLHVPLWFSFQTCSF